ncbi:MAG: hypothetical protein E6R04_06365 [Spirochaetes bacterium]|nr:MAG: hypothetical protein E6R04_06365 [Spirochaetota bacterium]
MTVSTTLNIRSYTGDNSTLGFAFPYLFYNDDHLKVYVNGALQSSGYTVSGAGSPSGGTVTFSSAPASGASVIIQRSVPLTQETDLENFDGNPADVTEKQFDLLAMTDQQLNEAVSRSILAPLGATLTSNAITGTITSTNKVMVLSTAGPAVVPISDLVTDIDSAVAEAQASAAAAASSASDAADSATTAQTAATNNIVAVLAVAAIDDEVQTCADNITKIVEVADGIDQIGNGKVTVSIATAPGNAFTVGKIGVLTSTGVVLANASSLATTQGLLLMATATIPGSSTGLFLLQGLQTTGFTGLDAASTYYVSEIAGEISRTPPYTPGSVIRAIGSASSSTSINFSPSPTYAIVQESATSPPVIYESSSSAYSSTGTVEIPAPDGTETGDLLLLFASTDFSTSADTTYTAPDDFEPIVDYTRTNSGVGEGISFQGWYKFAGSEPATYTLTETSNRLTAVSIHRISGADPTTPIEAQALSSDHLSEPSITSVTTTVDQTLNLVVATWDAKKTLIAAPDGYTTTVHVDLDANPPGTHDHFAGWKKQTFAGATGALAFNLSGSEDWIGLNLALRKQNATAGAGGGGSGNTGPFDLSNDGNGYATKLTLPVNKQGVASGETDAYEIYCSTDPQWEAGEPTLETYTHPIYFLRTPTAYRMSSMIRPGAYTSSNTNGPARTEFRHQRNYGPTERIRYRTEFEVIFAAPLSKITCMQIHRVNSAPVFKMSVATNSAGTSFTYRSLVKKTGGSADETVDKDGKDNNIASGLLFGNGDGTKKVSFECDWNPTTGDLKLWVNKADSSGTPDRWYTGVYPVDENGNETPSYIKPGGVYSSSAGTGQDTDLFTIDVISFNANIGQAAAPVNITSPTITGDAVPFGTLSCSSGVWTGSPTPTITYQWKANGSNISGETASTTVLPESYIGQTITCTVTATNSEGSATKTTAGVALGAGADPANTAVPTISGNLYEGGLLTATPGVWTGSPTPTISRQWYRGASTLITGATGLNYTAQNADVGSTVFIRETASNGRTGTFVANSASTGTIAAEPSSALLHTVVPSTVFELDATNSDSHPGTGSTWYNLTPNPADGSAKSAYNFSLSGLTFTGSAGDPAAYLLSAGSGSAVIGSADVASMPAFIKALGKLTGGTNFWFLMAAQLVNSAGEQTLFSTAGVNATDLGVRAYINSAETARFYQRGDANSKLTAQSVAMSVGTGVFWAMCHDAVSGATTTWNGTTTGNPTDADYYETTSAVPSEKLRIGARSATPDTPLVNTTRLYTVAMGNGTLTDTDVQNMVAILESRHSRDYTP